MKKITTRIKLSVGQKYIHYDGKTFFTITAIDKDYVSLTCVQEGRPEYKPEWRTEEIRKAIRNKYYTLEKLEVCVTKQLN